MISSKQTHALKLDNGNLVKLDVKSTGGPNYVLHDRYR